MNGKTLFIDLDETLIHSRLIGEKISSAIKRGVRKNSKLIIFPEGEAYDVVPLPSLNDVLQKSRSLFETVIILTAATREYAEIMNKEFSMGFLPEHIISRESYIGWERRVYSCGETSFLMSSSEIINKDYYLVDNSPFNNQFTKYKILYKGIPNKNIFVTPDFGGNVLEGKNK